MLVQQLFKSPKQRLLRNTSTFTLLSALSFLAVALWSCTDDSLPSPSPSKSPSYGSLVSIDLPGYIGINLAETGNFSTRDSQQSSDGKPFDDGLADEFALSLPNPSENEYYHYLLLYDEDDSNSKPLVLPIDVSDYVIDSNSKDNTTLTVSKVITNETSDANGDLVENFSSIPKMTQYIASMKPYVLLNFKLQNTGEPNYILSNGSDNSLNIENTTTEGKTVEILANLTKSQLENLRLRDYKVSGFKKINTQDSEEENPAMESADFFTMTNSVYASGSSKVFDGKFDHNKVYGDADMAKADPGLFVHVERLAAKVTVGFDIAKMSSVKFGPNKDRQIDYVSIGTNGLPEIHLKVDQVNMDNGKGITFNDQTGYKIETKQPYATIRILGYGLSNLETSENLYKDINPTLGVSGWSWNDGANFRSYWARDPHYAVTKSGSNILGYPHQFRLALDADSVYSYHTGLDGGYSNYDEDEYRDDYKLDGKTYPSYCKLGEIDVNATRNDAFLKYKSFQQLSDEFRSSKTTTSETVTGPDGQPQEVQRTEYTFYPLYTLENTYYDQGMLTLGQWHWPWQREPYATATNLILMAEIEIEDNAEIPSDDQQSLSLTRDGATTLEGSSVRTVYLGQNNIFYLRKVHLLRSKLAILNDVMLSGGNAGFQILHGQWDRHKRWTEGDENQYLDTHLDKVAWNENSKLWFVELEWDEKTNGPVIEKKTEILDEKGEPTGNYNYTLKFNKQWIASVSIAPDADENDQDLDLIPAEISGGDGQALIAPNPKWMGSHYRYYLAPESPESTDEDPQMDRTQAVEISFNHLVALIHKIIGPIDVYTNGKMYFSVPVPHRLAKFGSSVNTAGWKTFGAFSVVRNNWYDITVTEITRLGTPVHDIYQPIVPVMDVKRSYINLGVELKDWHNIVQEDVPVM